MTGPAAPMPMAWFMIRDSGSEATARQAPPAISVDAMPCADATSAGAARHASSTAATSAASRSRSAGVDACMGSPSWRERGVSVALL